MLDPASPVLLRPVFAETLDQLQRIDGGLEVFRRLGGRVVIVSTSALSDGAAITEFDVLPGSASRLL